MKLPLLLWAALGLAASLAAKPNTLTPQEKADGWHLLFDGHSLDGWKAGEHPATFRVADGEIVVDGPRAHLFYTGPVGGADFTNFELSVEVLTKPKANSGVYFHTKYQEAGWPGVGYEVQVNNSHKDPKRTAGLYGIKDNFDVVAADDRWFTLSIRVEGKHIVTRVDGKVISDFTEPAGWTPPKGFEHRKLGHGTIALQGHDPESIVHYRNLKIRLLP